MGKPWASNSNIEGEFYVFTLLYNINGTKELDFFIINYLENDWYFLQSFTYWLTLSSPFNRVRYVFDLTYPFTGWKRTICSPKGALLCWRFTYTTMMTVTRFIHDYCSLNTPLYSFPCFWRSKHDTKISLTMEIV